MDDNLQETAQRFLKLSSRLRRLGSGESQADAVTTSPSHLALIEYVATHPDCGIQEMADALKLSTPTVSISVRQLEKSKLMARKPNPEDGRAVQLSLTPKGEEIQKQDRSSKSLQKEFLFSKLEKSSKRWSTDPKVLRVF